MSEAGSVEYPIRRWLSGYDGDIAADKGLGWTYRDEAAMAEVTTQTQARMAVAEGQSPPIAD